MPAPGPAWLPTSPPPTRPAFKLRMVRISMSTLSQFSGPRPPCPALRSSPALCWPRSPCPSPRPPRPMPRTSTASPSRPAPAARLIPRPRWPIRSR
ncbi:hypothetical protein AZ78_1902 [Lysobacter capsici AZ78]|uniref:Uncharacterized protein n=1 Tax=Lysobacter capsici AZ78 TaxID=1444315 RepID=A0A120AGB6_9GAMM|nr:hypothetical protein AZ78_1902 [Lysobacter capsici AZ78]